MTEEEEARKVMARAIRRLNVLEYVILAAAAGLALLAGGVVAWILNAALGVSFRVTWIVASVLFFGIPGSIAYGRDYLARRDEGGRTSEIETRSANDG